MTDRRQFSLYGLLAALATAVLLHAAPMSARPPGPAEPWFLAVQQVAAGFDRPVGLANVGLPASGDRRRPVARGTNVSELDGRLFVIEQPGRIRIVLEDGTLLPDPFLDISDRVGSTANWEQGLLGLAFHPDYPFNGRFYVNYTDLAGDTHVSRFQVDPLDPDRADPASETAVLFIDQPGNDHNAGDLHFGPDGYLYVAQGDGGSQAGYPNAPREDRLLGKLLRIDVDGRPGYPSDCDPAGGYTIPLDNPLADGPGGACDEIWALGLRNPWRFSFDRLAGDLYIGDVGVDLFGEINHQAAGSPGGANFGWPCYEGEALFFPQFCDEGVAYHFPIGGIEHESDCAAVIGGFVYRGGQFPQMDGRYLFAELCSGRFWQLYPDGEGWRQEPVADTELSVSSLGEGPDGELYATDLAGGAVYRLTAAPPAHQQFVPAFISE